MGSNVLRQSLTKNKLPSRLKNKDVESFDPNKMSVLPPLWDMPPSKASKDKEAKELGSLIKIQISHGVTKTLV
jgi:hypothetical protein